MRLAIDVRAALDPRRTGVGHYAQQLVRHIPHADPDDEFVAWYLHARGVFRSRRFFADGGAPNLTEDAARFPARVFEPLSARLGIPRLEWFLDFDALLATNFLPPATRSRSVVMVVHDLAFRVFPDTAPQIDERWLRRFRGWLSNAARVIVPSHAAQDDLCAMEEVDPDKIVVIPHGVDAEGIRSAGAKRVEAARKRLGLDRPYLLFVGGIEPRKNLPALVHAFARLDEETTLVIAGGKVRWFPDAADRLREVVEALPEPVRRRVILAGYVSEGDKLGLLAGARGVVYPSLYEGFGFPVLEGMAARVPVLTSNVSSLPEVAGDAAILVDPHDEGAIVRGLDELLHDEDLRERLIAAGLARAARFTWEDTSRRTAGVLREVASEGGG
ncbi:MAG TPA: glycosyltransferase family 1 protein [Actinomycetota bacterium]|nr:glycosyltransferase family 1 protein [Actinomycetota bacterium]